MQISEHPSPNFGPRRGVDGPDMVVLHYTGMDSGAAAVARLCDPSVEVSAHYLVDLDGTVVRMVDEAERAWHAGVSAWGGQSDINSRSIGIEIANPGHACGCPPFPEPQMAALEDLLKDVLARWRIVPERVVGHACIAPGRKIDPGEQFDWRRLALQGLAVWLDPARPVGGAGDAGDFQAAARRFGYEVPQSGEWCARTLDVWGAFAMRFLPQRTGQAASARDVAHLEALAGRWPALDPEGASA